MIWAAGNITRPNATDKDHITVNGPERPKWNFQRAAAGIKLDFDAPKTTA